MSLIFRRAVVPAAAVAVGVIGMAGPATADVTVSPPSAPQGSGVNVHLDVENTAQRAITKVKLVMPVDTPVAEVYPLSVDDWAPMIENTTLDTPLTSIHGGAPVTETAASITWIAVQGKAIAPGESAELAVALGPLPTTRQLTFTVVPTYADGRVGPAMPPAVLSLTPASPDQPPAGHGGHGGTAANGTGSSSGDGASATIAARADQGPGFWSIAGWLVAGLAVAGALVVTRRGHRTPGTGEPVTSEPVDGKREPAAAKISAWSFRDGPVD